MRRYGLGCIAVGTFLFQGGFAMAQNSLQALEAELREAKQHHQEVSSQAMANFFSQIDAAMASPDAAVALYQQAGGTLPDPSPVVTEHESETATEKATRLALDQANLSRLGMMVQLHCGLMHYAALLVVKPDQKGLQAEWVAWLKRAALIYPQLNVPAATTGPKPPPVPHKKKKGQEVNAPDAPRATPFNSTDLKGKAMHDSVISKFLAFRNWGNSEQGGWSLRDLPKLYRTNILEPLRIKPTAATLAAWDAYIGMLNADEKDDDKWNQVTYPPLQFDRACDDYAIAPSAEKLEGLVNLIKANPTYPQVDDWISRAHQLLDDYSASHGGKPATVQTSAPAPVPSGDPNVIVTTQQQGDMTIITTHTNSAPNVNQPPPPSPR